MANIYKMCSVLKKKQLDEFCDSHKHDKNVTHMRYIEFCERAMYLVSDCTFTGAQKKTLVLHLYGEVASCNTNDFVLSFEIGNCIQFCWNLSSGKLSITPKKSIFCCVTPQESHDTMKQYYTQNT
jgi:hypothetical protein